MPGLVAFAHALISQPRLLLERFDRHEAHVALAAVGYDGRQARQSNPGVAAQRWLASMSKFLVAFLIFFAFSPACSAGETQMQSLFKIGLVLASARNEQPGGLCSKSVIPDAVSARISQLLSTINGSGLKDELGGSPALYAVMADDPVELGRLLKLGYDTSGSNGSLLDAAAFWDSERTARLLLDRGMDPNIRNGGGGTPLMVAVSEGGPDVARLLLSRGARVDTRTLRYALVCKDQGIVDLIVQAGAGIDDKTRAAARRFHMRLPGNGR